MLTKLQLIGIGIAVFVWGMSWFAFCACVVCKRSDEAMRRIGK